MKNKFTMFGWHLSYFAGKLRCYLRYKRIPFVDQPVSLFVLAVLGRIKTGVIVMPTLRLPEGNWMQDTSTIIDYLEERFPEYPIIPTTPVQRFAAYLLEAWGDEWWIPIAMHTRWTYTENFPLFERDAGSALLPHFPRFIQNKAAGMIATKLRGMCLRVGIRREQFKIMDAWTDNMLDLLEAHFTQHAYLLGERPTLADFGLVGTMYGHLGRDPWPARVLIAPRPHLRHWIDRMAEPPPQDPAAALLPDDTLAPTLMPILQAICAEFLPMLEGTAVLVRQLQANWPADKPLPRGLRDVEFNMGKSKFKRNALPYMLWMAQRVRDVVSAMPPDDQMKIHALLQSMGGERLLTFAFPRLIRSGVRVRFDGAAA